MVKKKQIIFGLILAGALIVSGVVFAAFVDKGKVLGSSFSTGTADIKLLKDLSLGAQPDNLADEMQGPTFDNIHPQWYQYYPIKIFNNGTYTMDLTSTADYETANDPDDLRQYLYGEIFSWDDTNNNNIFDEGEQGQNFGRKTITKWKTEGFDLGYIDTGQIKGYVIKFLAEELSDTKQGKTGVFDFEFNAVAQGQ